MKMSIENRTPSPDTQRYQLSGETMGTRYTALFYGAAQLDTQTVKGRLAASVARVDQQMSNWKTDSDLNRLNAAPAHQWFDIPKELVSVLCTALQVSRQSHGAFEISVGNLVQAWGFGPADAPQDSSSLKALQQAPRTWASRALQVDPVRQRVFKHEALRLDLNGIAKGFAVDELAHCLEGLGITAYLVGIDGEMRARGLKPDGQAWCVAIEKPKRGVREVMGVMELSDAAIATSGDYRHWLDIAGQSYAHTMDPVAAAPLRNRLAAVTVVASTCMLADAWATALMVLGEQEGPRLAQASGMDAVFVVRDGEHFKEIAIVAGQRQTHIETR